MREDLHRLDRLATAVSGDPSVIAILGLGSAGQETHRFDDHSDIDFFVVVTDADAKRRYLDDIAWLGGFGGEVIYEFVNDPNGRKALFADGLFLEYAIFTPAELQALPLSGVRVVWSRPDFHYDEIDPPARGALDTVEFHLNEALTNLFVGLHRQLRGERLTAMRFIQVYAVDRVLALQRLDPGTTWADPDPFEATRRVESARGGDQPDYSRMAPGYNNNVDGASAILAWLNTNYPTDPHIVSAIEDLLATAASASTL